MDLSSFKKVQPRERFVKKHAASFYRQETITARQWYKEGRFGEIIYTEGEYYTAAHN